MGPSVRGSGEGRGPVTPAEEYKALEDLILAQGVPVEGDWALAGEKMDDLWAQMSTEEHAEANKRAQARMQAECRHSALFRGEDGPEGLPTWYCPVCHYALRYIPKDLVIKDSP